MDFKEVYIATKNNVKWKAAKNIFSKYGINILQLKESCPEIQANSSLEIARFTACYISKEFKIPIIREDHSLYITALGIPGPYTAFIDKKLDAKKLLSILSLFKDRSGFFEVSAVYADQNGKQLEHVYTVPIKFSEKIKGNDKYSWNSIIMLKNGNKTFAELGENHLSKIFNKNFVWFAKNLVK